jgi:hypothetical protein
MNPGIPTVSSLRKGIDKRRILLYADVTGHMTGNNLQKQAPDGESEYEASDAA